jgi:tetratricopeptide (TPR) repeat protein
MTVIKKTDTMKKLAVLILMMTIGFGLNAQNSNVTSAYNYLRYGKLDKALVAIDKATENPKTSEKAKTWFYRGKIYLSIAMSDDEKFQTLDPDALNKGYEALLKYQELADENDEFAPEAESLILVCAEQYYNKGVSMYNTGASTHNTEDYEKAMEAFSESAKINESVGRVDSLATYNAALCAELAGLSEPAIKYYEKLIDMKYYQPGIFTSIAELEKAEGDTAAAMEYIKMGREIYPDNFNLIIAETNFYLATGNKDKAMELLQLAIAKDDSNPTLFFAVGTNYDQMGNFEEAEKNYKNAIALDPEYFDANYNLGALYVNKAIAVLAEANALPLNEEAEYNALKEKADGLLEKSLPYLEKADEIQPDDQYTLRTLKDIYTRLGMLEKLKGVNERLGE